MPPAARPRARQSRLVLPIAQRIDMGAKIGLWAAAHPDVQRLRWQGIARDVFNLMPSGAVTQRLKRTYQEWLDHTESGRLTAFAAGATCRRTKRRAADEPSSHRRHQGQCVEFELLQWFVDEIESVKGRADARQLMDHARWLRAQLAETGVDAASLPKIDKHWLYRCDSTTESRSVAAPQPSRSVGPRYMPGSVACWATCSGFGGFGSFAIQVCPCGGLVSIRSRPG